MARITAAGVMAAGREYELDCVIYGSGFEVGTPYERRVGFEVAGRDGFTLSEHWADGMRTLHGIHVRGFPNLLFVQPTQGANLISNVPHNIVDSARTIAAVVRHAADGGFGTVEPAPAPTSPTSTSGAPPAPSRAPSSAGSAIHLGWVRCSRVECDDIGLGVLRPE